MKLTKRQLIKIIKEELRGISLAGINESIENPGIDEIVTVQYTPEEREYSPQTTKPYEARVMVMPGGQAFATRVGKYSHWPDADVFFDKSHKGWFVTPRKDKKPPINPSHMDQGGRTGPWSKFDAELRLYRQHGIEPRQRKSRGATPTPPAPKPRG